MPEIVFNDELWNTGFKHNCHAEGNILCAGGRAIYISKSVDSLENATVWNRLKLELQIPEDGIVRFSYFACDYKTVYHNNCLVNIDEIIEDDGKKAEEKIALTEGLWISAVPSPADMPLFKAKGRYFWFKLEFVAPDCSQIKKCKIYFRLDQISEYLPEFYRREENDFDFLNRFLSMFQGVYSDMDKEISNISRFFDADCADYQFLKWLSAWVAVDEPHLWQEDVLRKFVKNAYGLYEIKGTKECMIRAVMLYTKKKPFIVENCEASLYGDTKLYGDNIYSFAVIVDEESVPTAANVTELRRIVEYYKPIHANVKIVVLKSLFIIGQYTYLGVNTKIMEATNLELNEKSIIPFGTAILK